MSDYKIAICDDTEAYRNYIKDLVTRWAHSSNQQIDIHLFSSAEEFLFEYEEDKGYQILLLDIVAILSKETFYFNSPTTCWRI